MAKISRRSIIVALLLLFAAVMCFYLWRDLHLTDINTARLPDIVVENISADRVINGKRWQLVSPRAEHRDGIIYGDSLDITISELDGSDKRSRILAEKGTFTMSSNDITLTDARGTMFTEGKTYSMKSGIADYKSAAKTWNFSRGLFLTDNKMTVSGDKGVFNTSTGNCKVVGRGKITWKEKE